MASSKRLLLPSLPCEVIEEILYKTPGESLIRFKLTCKQWFALITSNDFIYNHLHRSPERFIRIDDDRTVQIMDPVTGILSESPIPDKFRTLYPISSMVHCDGLMLCKCEHSNSYRILKYTNLAVWNPVLRKIKWIKLSVRYWQTNFFGIGYDNTSRDNYKILRFSGHGFYRDSEIYEFNSDLWRTIDPKFDGNVDIECEGVSVKGNMYWIATKKENFILGFDFSMETFKDVCVCPHYWKKRLGCFNGDRLSLLQQDEETGEIHVWVTNKLSNGVIVSFSRYINVTPPHHPTLQSQDHMARPGYSIGKHKIIMAWCERLEEEDDKLYTCITLYEFDQGGVRKQIETGRNDKSIYCDPLICSYVYVPSLVPVPE